MLHSLLVLHYTDVVASVEVQKAPKEGDYRVSEVLEYYIFKIIRKKSSFRFAKNVPSGLVSIFIYYSRRINNGRMRISIAIPLHVLEVPYYQNYLEYHHSKKN